MENSYRFFANRECEYYPCHKDQEPFNCLFCYCPFYLEEKCPGSPSWLKIHGKIIKDCTLCTFPHRPESYDAIINWIVQANEHRTFSEEIEEQAVEIKSQG